MTKKRVITIGLDGMPRQLLDLLIKRGHCPNLDRLKKEGYLCDLQSTHPPLTGPAWVTFATGMSPRQHQCFDWVYPGNNISEFRPINSGSIAAKTFYETLHDNGLKSVLINMPGSYPARVPEYVITGMLTQGENCFNPTKLKEELKAGKDYRIVAPDVANRKSEEYISGVRETAKTRFEVAKELYLNKLDWSYFFLLFGASDWLQHGNYTDLINERPESDLIWKVYEDLDSYVGWFLNNISKNDVLMVMSDHGFQSYSKVFFPLSWLEKKGLLVYGGEKNLVEAGHLNKKKKRSIRGLQDIVLKLASYSPSMFSYLKKIYFKYSKYLPFEFSPYNAVSSNSKANYMSYCFYLNSREKFEDGVLDSESAYNIRNELAEELKNLKIDNQSVCSKVEVYEEPFSKDKRVLPDIVIYSDNFLMKTMRGPMSAPIDSQHHSSVGILMLYGNHKKIETDPNRTFSLVDLAPSILETLEVKIPSIMEGQSIFKR